MQPDTSGVAPPASNQAAALSGLFPAFVAQHSVGLDSANVGELSDQFPGVLLAPSLANAVRQRQLEFLAGRFCVREALRRCAPEHAQVVVGIGRQREPVWPDGLTGAITHTRGMAAAAVARKAHARGVGLDVESIDETLTEAVFEQIASSREVRAVASVTGWSNATAVTAIFSAKETLYKCLFPQVQRYFGFRDACLDEFALGLGTFRVRLLANLSPWLPVGQEFTGHFALDSGVVYTTMVLPA